MRQVLMVQAERGKRQAQTRDASGSCAYPRGRRFQMIMNEIRRVGWDECTCRLDRKRL